MFVGRLPSRAFDGKQWTAAIARYFAGGFMVQSNGSILDVFVRVGFSVACVVSNSFCFILLHLFPCTLIINLVYEMNTNSEAEL